MGSERLGYQLSINGVSEVSIGYQEYQKPDTKNFLSKDLQQISLCLCVHRKSWEVKLLTTLAENAETLVRKVQLFLDKTTILSFDCQKDS